MHSTIESWCKQYEMDASQISEEYYDLGNNTLGLTTFKYDHTIVEKDGKYRRIALIQIHEIFKGKPFATRCILWHEFCHAEKWIKDATSDGHGNAWTNRCWRKPILFIADSLYVNILFWQLKAKKLKP